MKWRWLAAALAPQLVPVRALQVRHQSPNTGGGGSARAGGGVLGLEFGLDGGGVQEENGYTVLRAQTTSQQGGILQAYQCSR